MRFWTHPDSNIPNRVLVEITWRGGHRHGSRPSPEIIAYDRWWRQRVAEIIRAS